MNKQIKQLNKQITKLKDQVYKLELDERIKINRKLIGKYFKFNNGYNPEEICWVYRKIIDITKEGYFVSIQFENNLNKISIQENNISTWHDSSWIKITEEEFLDAWYKCYNEVINLNDIL
jgi:hypothetical protein